jgi:hypothetical protein
MLNETSNTLIPLALRSMHVIDVEGPVCSDPAAAARATPVYILNRACTGTKVDTYTKVDMDFKLNSFRTELDTLTKTSKEICEVVDTRLSVEFVVALYEKLEKRINKIDEFLQILTDEELEPETETEMEKGDEIMSIVGEIEKSVV